MPMLMMPRVPGARRSTSLQARLIAATRHNLDAGAGEDPPFALQPGDREDHHMP